MEFVLKYVRRIQFRTKFRKNNGNFALRKDLPTFVISRWIRFGLIRLQKEVYIKSEYSLYEIHVFPRK